MKNITKKIVFLMFMQFVAYNIAYSQCTNTSAYGSATAATVSSSTVTISTCQYQTEYSTVSGIVAGYVYTFTNTAGGYVTVHSGSSGGPVIAQGNAPLTFTASVSGTIYPSWNTNASCGTASPCSTTSIVTVTGAPPPPPATNENCNTAISLTPSTTCSPTVGTLGTSQSLAGCSGTANDDVWYSFVAASTSQNISLTASASMDPVVQVFSGTCASLTSINCNDAAFTTGGSGNYTATGLTVGNTYYYRVYDYYSGTPSTTTFTTCVTTPPPLPTCVGNSPPGNTCAAATPICDLDGYCGSTTGYTANSWTQLTSAFCGSIENNSFLTFVASSSSISFNLWVTSSTMGYGIQIFIFQASGCSGAVSSYTCYNPGTANYGPTPITATGLTPGQTYYMMIDGNSGDICNYVIGANSGVNVPVTVTPATTSVCQGVPVNLSASGGNGAYTWSPAGGLSATTGSAVTATQAAVGTYTYTATSSTGNPLCPSSTTASATITVTNCGCTVTASNSGPVCAGGSLTLSATNAGAGYSYSWTGPGGYTSGVRNPTAFTAPATAGTYTYTVTATSGTITCNSSTIVTVNPIPTITAPTNVNVCAGVSVPATSLTSSPAGATYTWTNSNTAIGLAANGTGNVPAFTATNGTAAPISSTITITPTIGSCPGSSVTYVVTVNPQPTATFTPPINQCLNGNSFTFTNTGSTFGTASWTFPSGTPGTSSANSPSGITWAAAGTYTVTHTITSGTCTATNTVAITVYPRPNGPVLTPVHPTCGANNGAVNVTAATGGTPAYQYNINGGANTALTNYSPRGPGNYTVNVTDANGCTNSSTVTLTNVPGPTDIALSSATAHCGQSDGSITIGAVTGGTSGYTYTINGVAATAGTSGTRPPGTYTVVVTDANSCTYTENIVVANAAGPTGPNATPTNSTCGNANGTVTLAPPTTGTGPFTYSFNGGAFAATTSYTGLAANTYTYVVRDNFGCTVNGSVVVANTAGPTALALTPTNASCGASNGSFTIGATTGGVGPMTYSVTGISGAFNGTTNYTSLAAGTYTVTVRDANGCTFTTNTTINNSGGPTALVLTPTNANCGSSNGSFTIGATTGGVGPMTYSVTGISGAFNGTTSYPGLAAGTYTVTVRDANGCTFTTNTTINNNSGPTALALTPVGATCGLSNGSFTIGATTGGTGPMTYSVTGISGAFNGTTSYTALAPNTYTVTVRDANGCTFTANTTVGSTTGPTNVVLTPLNSTCGNANGSFTIGAVTGGTAAYTYSVAPGAAGFTSTTNYPGLAAGTFTVTVRDANACTYTTTTTVANTAGPTAVALTPVNTSCGGTTGTLTIGAVTGGTAAYTYSVSPGPAGFNATTNFTNLAAATYTVVVRDANNCQFTQTSVVGNNPGPTAVALTPVSATCGASNGSFTIGAVTGGTAGYTYSVNGSAFTATTNYTALAAATYTVVVQDANGCQFTSNTTVNNSGGPTAVVLTPVDATCGSANGSFTIGAVTGGAGGNTYSVNGSGFTGTTNYTLLAAGTYTVIVRDANNCSFTTTTAISNSGGPTAQVMSSTNSACSSNTGTVTFGATTGGTGIITYSFDGSAFTGTTIYNNVAPGTYNAIVRDGNNCQFATTVTVGTVAGPTDVVLTPANSTCGNANGSFAIGAVTGGSAAYTYSINGGAFVGTTTYNSQLAGTYTVVVRDANGCTYTENVTVANTPGPTAFAVSSTNSTCGNSNGVATAGAVTTSGSTTYQYSINGGALGASTSFTGLAAATYTLLVQDGNGCQLTNTVTVANTPGPTAQVLTPVNSTCGNANGSVTIGATTGGTGLITYSFNGGAFSGTTSYTSLAAGTYTVVAQDANNCQFTQTTVVSNLPGPTALALTTVSATCGGSNGAVNVGAVTGGSGTNTYSFNGSPFTATTSYTGLIAGTYTVIVQDVNLCQFTQTVAVNNSGGPTAVVLTPTNSTCGNPNGSIAIGAVTGGAGTINYSLNGGALSATTNYTGLVAGTYTVLVSDVNACTFSQTVTVNNTAGPTGVAITPTNSTCGNSNGSIAIGAVTGGTSGYTYSINGSGFTATTSYTGLLAGTYTIGVQDANNCQYNQTADVLNIAGPTSLVLTPTNSTCSNPNGVITLGAVIGGTSPYEYSLNGAAFVSSGPYLGLAAATYTVVIRDANLCTYTVTTNVADTPGPTAQATSTTNSTCGNANGIVSIGLTTGGTAPYQYSFDGGALSATTSYTTTAGSHTVLVSDANLCTFTVTTTVNNTAGPTAVALTSTPTNCGNSNGTIVVGTVTGGTSAFEYSIDGGVSYQPSTSFLALAANTYTITVRDINLCTITNTVVVSNLSSPVASVVTQTNVSCFGGNNGSVTLTGTGGATPYTYTLNTGQTNGSGVFNTLVANTYTLTIADAAGCSSTSTFTISQSPALVGSIASQTNVSCFAGSNGSVTVTEIGGTSPFTYSINGGAFGASPTFGSLSATDYTVTVSDNFGCISNVPVTITQPTQIVLTMSSVNANCTDDNGTASVAATGGTPGYTYSWTGGGGTAATTVPVVTGHYTVTVLDANLCPMTGDVVVDVTPGGTASISNIVNVSCFGGSDGALTVSMGGGATAPFTYAWSPNVGTTATVSNLPIGTYSVTVTDVHGCIATANGTIAEPVALALNFTSTNVSCNAGSDGTVSSVVTGGRTPYTYLWSPGAFNTPIISGLPVGTYSLVVTDANGCTVTGSRSIVEPTALTITPTITHPNCNQANGSATVVGGGGAGGYTFSLNGGAFGAGSFSGLLAGTYTVTIRDGNQCTTNLPLTLIDQAGPTATITASTNVSCNGGTNGSATVTASGGTTPYFYSWNPSSQTTQTANNLSAGVYGVTVTDATGCVAAASIIITEPATLIINATGTDPVCNGQTNGTGTSSAFGGTAPYSYQWAVLPIQNTANATGLASGTHAVTVTDALGCTATTSITLVNPPLLTATINRTNLLCNSICNGTASAVTTNGTAPFAYTWNDANAQTTQTATGLCAGNYTVNIVDFKGCTATAVTTLTEPSLLTSTIINPVNVTCAGLCNGSGTVSATGGVGPYAYSWSNLATTATNTNLCVGSYTVNVTDINGCESQSILSIIAPNPLVVSASSTNATCYNLCDGTATATFSGGTAPYTFLWQPSLSSAFNPTALCDGTHTVTVTDANGCTQTASTIIAEPAQLIATTTVNGNNFCNQSNGSAQVQVAGGTSPFSYLWTNGATGALNTGLAGGVYAVDVTDANGCTVNAVANVNDIPAPTIVLNSSTDITCFGLNNGVAVLGISGGTTPYSSQTWLMPVTLIPNANQAGTGLWPGNNVFQVIDAVGCISSITVPITEPTQLVSATNAIVDVTCNGFNDGTATMLVNGGTTPYNYAWTDPALQTNPTASNLAAGTYNCNVTDANGCITSQTVVIDEPLPLVFTSTQVNIDCYGANNGSINVTPFGGTPAYVYTWTPSVGAGPVVTNLQPGSHTLLLTDSKGCTFTNVMTITEPSPFNVVTTVMPSTCSDPNASISLLVSGASAPYSYQWNDPALQTTSAAQNLAAPGVYTCVITDINGCTTSITEAPTDLPPPIISNIAVTNVTCYGGNDGTLTVTAQSGGSSSYTYEWFNSSNVSIGNGSFQGGLAIGTYQIVVTDANGCTVNGSSSISQPFPLSISVSQDQIACNGQVLGVYASAANGTPPYTYNWTGAGTGLVGGGNHNVTFTNTNTTSTIQTYSVAVTDANNCPSVSGQFIVTVLPKISVVSNDVTGCLGENVSLEAIAGGGDGVPYTFTWGTSPTQVQTGSSSTVSVPVTSNFPVSYNLTVTDGCSTQETIIVNVSSNPKPSASMIGINTQGCADLTVSFSGNGGNNFPNCTYAWSFGDGSTGSDSTTTHTYTSTGLQVDSLDVQMIVTTPLGCSDTVVANNYILVYPNPVAEFSYNPTEISEFEPTVNFYNESLLGATFNWNFGDASSLTNLSTDENPIHVYNDPGTYDVNLIVTSALGCRDTVTHSLYVTPEFALYVPNAFSPTGDFKNEIFTPQGIGIDEERYNMYIYNRWGELIYETNNFAKGWDGKIDGNVVQIDTYVYKIVVYDLRSEKHTLTGHVTVVR